MAGYYLISQLPSLDGISDNMPLPITEERFSELCHQLLGKKTLDEMKRITLLPERESEDCGSDFINNWLDSERKLRLALAKVRAQRLNKSFDTGNTLIPLHYQKAAEAAMQSKDPLEAEKLLCSCRLELLEAQRPMDGFSVDYVFYYGIKLKLISRLRGFDTEAGEAAYKNIYNSVLMADSLEVAK